MTAPDNIWAGLHGHSFWQKTPHHQMTEYIRADLHQSALADRDATIARLQAELVAKDDAWIADQTANANEIIRLGDKLERLQARLDAWPGHGAVRELAQLLSILGRQKDADKLRETANRMEAANAE